jgi:hypothetical protein
VVRSLPPPRSDLISTLGKQARKDHAAASSLLARVASRPARDDSFGGESAVHRASLGYL